MNNKIDNYGTGSVTKYLFTSFDDWDKFKDIIAGDEYPLDIHPSNWIEPDRIPFIMLHVREGGGWYNMEFVYPDDFPKIYMDGSNWLNCDCKYSVGAGTVKCKDCGRLI